MTKAAVKKVAETQEATVLTDVKAYARQIWLAGLGAYAKAGKEGLDYFKGLVTEGEGVEKQGKELVAEQVEAANSKFDSVKKNVKTQAQAKLDVVEKAFDERVSAALGRLSIPSKKDVAELSAKIYELNAAIKKLSAK